MLDESDDAEQEPEREADFSGPIILAFLLPVFFIFRHFGRIDLGLNACVCLGMNLLAVRIRWDLRNRVWFWVVVTLVVALNVPIVLMVPWPHAWVPGIVLLPLGLADLLLTLGVVRLTEKL